MWKNAFIFYYFLNSLGNTHVTAGGTPKGPRPGPTLAQGSGFGGSAVNPPKTQVSLVRMRPREFGQGYHKNEHSASSSYIRALRVRVWGRAAHGPHPRWSLLHDVITPWRHYLFDWQVTWSLAERWLVHLYHVTQILLSDWFVPEWPPLLINCQNWPVRLQAPGINGQVKS